MAPPHPGQKHCEGSRIWRMDHRGNRYRKVSSAQAQILSITNCPFPAPAKPKLVARAAGSETSPWKIKKDAPKISAQDVPGALRPLMSCALWRLHESIERNDPNQLFLLSDQTEIQGVAQKLSITVRSCRDVAATIASRTYETDLETFGDLEKIFGVQQKIVIPPTEDNGEANGKHSASDNADEDLLKDVDVMNHSVTSEGTANTEASSIVHEQDYKKQDFEREMEKSLVNADHCEDEVKEQDIMAETADTLAAKNVSKTPAKSVESIKSLVDSIIQQDFQKHVSGTVNGLKLDSVKGQGSLAGKPALEHSVTRSRPGTPLPQPQSVESVQRSQEVQAISDIPPPMHTGTPSTSIGETAQEPEDSDEEVVVFVPQPKRFSAQRNPAQQGSRPSTPKEQAQQKPTAKSPETSLVKPQPKARSVRHSPKPSVLGHIHPQPVNSPTIIDPDAFGRDFRVNLNSSPRVSHNPNGHSNRRMMRGNIHNAQVGQVPRNSPRHFARTSPPRNAPQESSRRPTVVPGRSAKDAPYQGPQASRASPRRSPTPKVDEVAPSDVESRATTVAELSKSHLPGHRTVESTDFDSELPTVLPGWNTSKPTGFVPRPDIPNAELKFNGPQPRIYEPGEFVPRPSRPVREFKQRPTKPKVFEAAEFVPRDFVPRTTVPRAQPRQHLPEPESIEPRPSINDVDFVLKSGSTRASARGKGRLWTPS